MKFLFIGDVHGKFDKYKNILKNNNYNISIQVGDFGIGFPNIKFPTSIGKNNFFIRGNHDNPFVCKKHPNYIKDGEYKFGIFFLGGAMSIDRHLRTPGIDWWEEEELSILEFYNILNIYEDNKPSIVVSHDCPTEVFNIKDSSRTRQFMNTMLEIHRPNLWIFGHHHISVNKTINNTNYICLNELEAFIIEI